MISIVERSAARRSIHVALTDIWKYMSRMFGFESIDIRLALVIAADLLFIAHREQP